MTNFQKKKHLSTYIPPEMYVCLHYEEHAFLLKPSVFNRMHCITKDLQLYSGIISLD